MRTAISMLAALMLLCLTAAPAARAQTTCVGDCDGNGMVGINELILGVNIALDLLPITECEAFDCEDNGTVPINCLIQGVNNALTDCGMVGPEVERVFAVNPGFPFCSGGSCNDCDPQTEGCAACMNDSDCPDGQQCAPAQVCPPPAPTDSRISRTGLFNGSPLGNTNAANAFSPGPLKILMGKQGSNGVAPLRLKEDVALSAAIINETCFCVKLLAAGSGGSIDCDGGTPYDTQVFQAAGEGPAWTATYDLGEPSGPGDGNLRVMAQIVYVMEPCAVVDCSTHEYPDPPVPFPFTTTNAIAIKGNLRLTNHGEAFDCANFGTTGSGGALAAGGAITIEPVGDTADTIRLSDKP